MPIAVVGLILLSVTLSAIAQISLKIGMSSPAVSTALAQGRPGGSPCRSSPRRIS
ncbi:hypothetical protein [Azospirillum sp. INR13]|uniref:hypothetical protein n=1 Tax=Azospirillum sp. INR13 TaxID=2596919 RepID=UPI00189273CE|nr:hypothetical protein [Azospirillum sp. INR13]